MAFHNNPRIVTNGLIWCIDANDTNSYPGSGTAWNNIGTAGGSATLVHDPPKTSSYGGAISFDGANDYATVASMGAMIPDGDISVDIVFNRGFDSSAGEERIFYIYNGLEVYFRGDWAGNSCYLLRKIEGSNHFGGSAWSGYTGVALASGDVGAPGLRHLCFTLESSSTSGIGKGYIEGVLERTDNLYDNNAGGTDDHEGFKAVTSSTTGFIATTSASGSKADCDIASFKIYDRVLSESEVKQNYNAHKSRFGF